MNTVFLEKGLYYLFLSIIAIWLILSSDYRMVLILFLLTVITSMISVNFALHHPFVWFLPFYFMYSGSGAILMWQEAIIYNDSVIYLLKASWFSMLPLILIINTKIESYSKVKIGEKNNLLFFKIIWGGSIVLSLASLISISSSGLTNKRDMNIGADQIFSFPLSFSILLLVFSIIVAIFIIINGKYPYKFVLFNLIFIFFAFLINGERDLFLRVSLISFMLYYVLYKRIRIYFIILIGVIMTVMVPIMHNLKNFWVKKATNDTLTGNWIVDIFSGEFISASNNLRIIYESNLEFKKGETLIWDVLRFFNSKYFSPTQWYNEVFFPKTFAAGGGQGFSFLGEGYLNFGLVGMLIWMTILALIIKVLYLNSKRSVITLLVYIISMPTFIYIMRADFSNLLSGVVKQVLLPLIILFVIYWILMQILPMKQRLGSIKYNSLGEE